MKNVDKKINSDIPAHSIPGCILEDSGIASVFNNNRTIMLIVDPENDQKVLDANEAACEFYGYSHEQFINLVMGDINTLSLKERQRKMKETIGKPHSYFNFVHKTRTGLLKDVEVAPSPVTIKNKKVMFIIVNDITVQKRVELKLRESQERLSLALDSSDLGMWDWHIQTGEVHYDEKWADLIGYTFDELSPLSIDTWRNYTHPDDLISAEKELEKYFAKQIPVYKQESRMKHKNGNWIWVLDRGKIFEWDSNGKPLRMAGTHLDITERKLTEIRLAESEAKFRSYFESSPLSLWEEDYSRVVDYMSNIPDADKEDIQGYFEKHPDEVLKCLYLVDVLNLNQATLDLYEANSKEEILNRFFLIFTESTMKVFSEELVSIYSGESLISKEFTDKTLKGKELEVKLKMKLLYDHKYLVTILDMKKTRENEKKLKNLLTQTKADSETKEILLKEINHRVKNNLSSLIGTLYTEKRKTKITHDAKQIDLIDSLINRVKGISIAHELLSRSSWKPISVELLTEKIINSLKHLVPSDRSIETEISKSSVLLDADQSQSMAVIINELFVNSLEYASLPGGTVKIDIKIVEKEGSVYYYYKDNGPGFSKEILKSKSFNVGLYLIKNIAEQSLRGKITLKNKNGAFIEIQFPGGGQIAEI